LAVLGEKRGADSAATLLAGCFFLCLRGWQWIVLSRLGVALWSFDALFVFGLEFTLDDSARNCNAQDDFTELFDFFDVHFWSWKGV